MKRILTPVVIFTSLCSASAFAAVMSPQHAPAPAMASMNAPRQAQNTSQLAQQVAQLQQEVNQLKQSQGQPSAKAVTPALMKSKDVTKDQHSVFGTFVVTGPSVGLPTHYDGSSLLVNSPSISTDYRLLQRSVNERTQLQKHGYQSTYPHIVLSGNVEAAGSFSDPYHGAKESDINLTGAELDTYMEITPWVNGFMTLQYDDTPVADGPGRVENSRFFLGKGFITVGNLAKSSVYGSVGQIYLPFGRYSHVTISAPLTEYVGRSKVRAALLGFHPNKPMAPYMEAFVFRGATNVKNRFQADQGGADAGFAFTSGSSVKGDFGVSVISNIADAQGMLDTGSGRSFSGFNSNNYQKLDHRVPAADLHGHLGVGPVTFAGDYIDTLRPFSKVDLSYRGRSAHISAGNLEMDLGFNNLFMRRPTTFALSYSGTRQASGLNLPKRRYMAAVQVAVVKDTLVTLGYRYDTAYGKSDVGGPLVKGASAPVQSYAPSNQFLGQHSQALTAQLDIYF